MSIIVTVYKVMVEENGKLYSLIADKAARVEYKTNGERIVPLIENSPLYTFSSRQRCTAFSTNGWGRIIKNWRCWECEASIDRHYPFIRMTLGLDGSVVDFWKRPFDTELAPSKTVLVSSLILKKEVGFEPGV